MVSHVKLSTKCINIFQVKMTKNREDKDPCNYFKNVTKSRHMPVEFQEEL